MGGAKWKPFSLPVNAMHLLKYLVSVSSLEAPCSIRVGQKLKQGSAIKISPFLLLSSIRIYKPLIE